MRGRDRNLLCWCNSGKKFKKCHYERIEQPRENLWAAVEVNHKAFRAKKCFAFDVGLGPCKGSIIKAHTVSRSSSLNAISKERHVLQYVAAVPSTIKNSGKLFVERLGINSASVFYGFCKHHDLVLFSCIENEKFTGRPDQCLAAAYRTLSREVYGKDAMSHLRETLRGADKGQTVQKQIALQATLETMQLGNEAARKEIAQTHAALTTALAENRPEIIRSLVLDLDGRLPLMFAGAWSPFTDLFGQTLQTGYIDAMLEQVVFTSFVGTNDDIICISWRASPNAPGEVIAKQVESLPNNQRVDACFQFVAKHVENIFYNPDWFEALSERQRKHIDCLAEDGVDILGSLPSVSIDLNLAFKLPSVLRSRLV